MPRQKNTHATHLEDLILEDGSQGGLQAIRFLRYLSIYLSGNKPQGLKTTTKFDGCVHKDTILLTDKGNMTIDEYVARRLKGELLKVFARDLTSRVDLYVDVYAAMIDADGVKKWVCVELEDGTVLKVTEDHEFHTKNRGWVEAKDLNENDDITDFD